MLPHWSARACCHLKGFASGVRVLLPLTMHCTHPLLYERDAQDACVVLEAVRLGLLHLWTRRLDQSERENIKPGNIYVWEEADNKGGLERWTDGRRWTQSRMRLDFLFYEETSPPNDDEKLQKKRMKGTDSANKTPVSRRQERPLRPNGLAKQTISMLMKTGKTTRRWHLVAYTSLDDQRYTIPLLEHYDYLRRIKVPEGVFFTTRGYPWNKKPPEDSNSSGDMESVYSSSVPGSPLQTNPLSAYPWTGARSPTPSTSAYRPEGTSRSIVTQPHSRVTSPARVLSPPPAPADTLRVSRSVGSDIPPVSAAFPVSPSNQYSPLTPEDRRALNKFPLRL